MNTDDMFNIIFWTLLGSMFLMRSWFGLRVWRTGERLLPDRAAMQREGLWPHVIEGLFFLLLAALIVHLCFRGGSLRAFLFPWPRAGINQDPLRRRAISVSDAAANNADAPGSGTGV